MAVGSATISDAGVESLSGAAGRLYTILKARFATKMPGGIPAGAAGVPFQRGLAESATDIATFLVTELTTYTTATVGTGLSGVQRMPAVTTEDTDTKAPSVAKNIPLVHTT